MKLRLPVALVCAAVALIAVVAASPAPHSTAPGSSAPPTVIPSAGPSGGTFIIQVEQGSVLHVRGASPCPAPPKRLSGSTIVVKAVIATPRGDSTASVVGSVSANGNWELQLPVPAEATLGLATLKLTCIAGTDSVVYYTYPTSLVSIIKAPPTPNDAAPPLAAAPAEPNWPPLLLLTLIGGMVLGRELPGFRVRPFGRVSAKASSEDSGADVAPDGGESGTGQGV
jgi:hypothetical protein